MRRIHHTMEKRHVHVQAVDSRDRSGHARGLRNGAATAAGHVHPGQLRFGPAGRQWRQRRQVRWGGQIIDTKPGPQETCFYVLQRPLDDQARPVAASSDSETQGRFVACRAGFYDPEVFTRGRDITVTGVIQGTTSEKIGEYNYAYPRVQANVVYLWPKRVAVNYYGPGYYDPFWGPYWGPGWGPWGGWGGWGGYGGYYGTRVIVRPPPPPPHR